MALTTVPVELANLDGAVTINEAGADADFRIEGDSQQNLFVVNGGTDDIGIGMSDPTFATGNGMQFADDFYLGFGTGNGTRPDFTIHGDNNGLEIACGTGADTADITIDTAGKVGISTTSPQAELHVKDASAGSRIIVEASASGQEADIQMKTPDDGQGWVLFNNGSANQGAIKYNHASDYMSLRTNGSDNRLYIDSGGKVNVGMTGGAGMLSVAGMLQMYTLTGAAQASSSVTLSLTQGTHAGGSSKQGSMMLFIGGYGNSLTGHVRAVYQIAGLMFYDHASTSTITQISESTNQCSLSVTRNGSGYDITLTNSNAAQTKSLAVTALLCAY